MRAHGPNGRHPRTGPSRSECQPARRAVASVGGVTTYKVIPAALASKPVAARPKAFSRFSNGFRHVSCLRLDPEPTFATPMADHSLPCRLRTPFAPKALATVAAPAPCSIRRSNLLRSLKARQAGQAQKLVGGSPVFAHPCHSV